MTITTNTVNVILSYLEIAGRDIVDDDYVFTSSKNNHLDCSNMNKKLKAYGNKAGLDLDLMHNHTLRHTCGTLLYIKTTDLEVVKNRLGHESIVTSQQYVSNEEVIEHSNMKHDAVFEEICNNLIAQAV